MKNFFYRSFTLLALIIGGSSLQAGILFYVPIPASESDPNSGISEENTYTTAVDGGNAGGSDRVINGITLYTLTGEGQSLSANNCSLTVLEGTVSNGGGAAESIKADGTMSQVVSDMTFNNEANDGSEQDIVLDPESLTPGTTYDLRVYISNPSGQNREVNLKFFGDGQPAVETGWFNEDDATTSAGGFKDSNQVYYINYRYTWDGDTTPGIAISQRYGRTPFCLYALTNQVVPGEEGATAAAAGAGGAAGAGSAAGAGAQAEAAPPAEEGGLTEGYLAPTADEVGVTSDTFYGDESLNSNGEWVDVGGYGKCWRPTGVSVDWRPYTNGRWGHCDDCGWTFISDEEWGWCTYHYGRWFHTVDSGWCWRPGTVWSPAWVSWRTGTDCGCVGWAPLPPEAGCEIGVGIGSWVDYTCGLGPDAYTFVNVVDFGAENFARCGTCLIDRGRYVNIYEQTTNITNISYTNVVNQNNQKYVNIYNGGPDANAVNTAIQKAGGKEVPKIHVNRYDDPAKIAGGKRSKLEGNTLSVAAPKIASTKTPQHAPKVATTIPKEKVDKGWAGVKDPKVKANLQNKVAQENKGKSPKTAPAKLPGDVASKLARKPVTTGHVKGLPKGAVVQQPGTRAGAATQGRTRPARPGERSQKGLAGQAGPTGRPSAGAADAAKGLAAPPKTPGSHAQKPGQRTEQQGRATTAGKAGAGAPSGAQGAARQGSIRPGQSLKKAGRTATGVAGPQGAQPRPTGQGARAGIQGKGAQQAQMQKPMPGPKAGGATGAQREGVAGSAAGQQKGQRTTQGKAQSHGVTEGGAGVQGPTQRRETKPTQPAQPRGHGEQAAQQQEQQRQLQQQQQQQATEKHRAAQQAAAQKREGQQRQADQQQRQRQQQQAEQQQQQRQRQQQAEQQQRQRQQQQAEQQQRQRQQAEQQQRQRQQQQQAEQQRQRQQQQQQQQAAQMQRQRQLQQAQQQQQRQLQQQQAQQQQRQLQQQQAQQQQRQLQQQQQRQPAGRRPTPTPVPR